jgi:hypothetical protein
MDADLLAAKDAVNEKATQRLKGDSPATDKIAMVEAFHGVVHFDRVGETKVLAIRQTAAGLDLEVLDLP